MKDIDFDELDRAVGSALGTDDAAHSETPTVSVASATDNSLQDDASLPVSTDAPETTSTLAVKPASPARRRGQFLDMVHPSADMRSTTPLPSMVRKKITPINVNTAPEPVSDTPDEADAASSYSSYPDATESDATDSNPALQVTEDTASAQDTPVEKVSWPDPIEYASSAIKVEDNPESKAETSEEPFVAAKYVTPDDDPETEPSQTPFVTDAKVDKRPLGAFAPTDEATEVLAESPHAADAAQLTASAETSAPEFSSDINSIEAAGVSQVESEDAAATEIPVLVEAEPIEKLAEEEPAPVTPEPTPPSTNDGVAQSIPQQYKTAEVKKDDDAHSLFDTKEYHQPLLLDGKKKSKKGVLIIILLVILLVIGATLGYFAYTMGI